MQTNSYGWFDTPEEIRNFAVVLAFQPCSWRRLCSLRFAFGVIFSRPPRVREVLSADNGAWF